MKKGILLATLISVLLGIVIGTLRSMATPTVTFAFVVPKAISSELPTCVPSVGDCRWKLWRVQRQAANPQWLSFDLYAKYRGKIYHAHGWRTGDTTRWLWVVEGHEYWLKAIKRYKADNPTHVTQGPALLEKIRDNQSVCDVVAPLIFVDITDDGGGIRQPNAIRTGCNQPTDGGTPGDCSTVQRLWPDGGAVANCASKWWLARCRLGGKAPSAQVDQDAGWLEDAPPSPGNVQEVPTAIPQGVWSVPDARTTKTCTVPVGQACP